MISPRNLEGSVMSVAKKATPAKKAPAKTAVSSSSGESNKAKKKVTTFGPGERPAKDSTKSKDNEYVVAQHLDERRYAPGGEGVYLDDVQRREAEVLRAKSEGREPDLENPPLIAGTPLVHVGNPVAEVPEDAPRFTAPRAE